MEVGRGGSARVGLVRCAMATRLERQLGSWLVVAWWCGGVVGLALRAAHDLWAGRTAG